MGSLYTPEAYDYFKRLEFKNLLSRFDQQETEQKELPSWRIVEDFAEAENIWNQAEQSEQTGVAVVDGWTESAVSWVAMEDRSGVFPGGRLPDRRCVMRSSGAAFCRQFRDWSLGCKIHP